EKKLNEVEIKTTKRTNVESAVVVEIKKSNSLVSGISAAQIQKTVDRNAAEAIRRVPGITVSDDRFVNVRGLSSRYNNVWLNDATAPSSETDARAFSFDVIPAGMIDRMMVYKTPSPELPGDFAGGMIKVYTQSIPDKSNISFGYSTSFRIGSTFEPFYYTQGSKTDLIGYDNGYRSLPGNMPDYLSKNDPDIYNITHAFPNNWGIMQKGLIPDQRANLGLQGLFKTKHVTIGTSTALTYSLTGSTYNVRRTDYDSTALVSDYSDKESTRTVTAAALQNIAFLFGNNKIELKAMLNQSGREKTTQRMNEKADDTPSKFYAESYQARTTALAKLCGDHKFNKDRSEYNYSASYSYTLRNDPDLRRINYTLSQPDTIYKASIANVVDPVNGGGLLYQHLREDGFSFNHQFTEKIGTKHYAFDVSAGNYIEYKYRSFYARTLGYVINPGYSAYLLTHQSVGQIFDTINTGSFNNFRLDEITAPSDAYKAQNLQVAAFAMVTLPMGKIGKIVTGLRYEYNRQSLQSFVNLDSIHPSIVTNFLLPSINMSFNVHENMLVRLAYGETVNRPEFREWSPFYYYDFELRAGNYGSLFPTVYFPNGDTLKVAQIHNVDVRYEYYPAPGDLIHAGAFFKYFIDPIQKVITPTGGSDSKAFTYLNGDHAITWGAEVEIRKNLGFIGPAALSGFTFVFNAAYIGSKLVLPDLVNQVKINKLQGQSPYIINAGLFYGNDSLGIDASIVYNVNGPRVYALGNSDYGNIGEMPFHSLDVAFSYTVKKIVTFTVAAQNILNSANRLMLDINRDEKFNLKDGDKYISYYKPGPYLSVGVKVKLSKLK
ncbi:MAG TPA: TonB-dependent receptor plug domain-containing protein, partial [Chitinophagales bacterium]|nr:TonB-dependent receptor plug domain-containing protein [Chitinophagales bacterium]